MDMVMVIRGALAALPGDVVSEEAVLKQLQAHMLTEEDSRLVLERAVMEGFLRREGDGGLAKLERAHTEAVPGTLAEP